MEPTKLTKTTVERLPATGKRYEVRDTDLSGFLVRVGADGSKSYYLIYRAGKGRAAPKKRLHLGAYPRITVEQARALAKEKAAAVVLGEDPAAEVRTDKKAVTMSDALRKFQDEHVTKLKPKSALCYADIVRLHILPEMGKLRVKDIAYADIARFHHSLNAKPSMANRSIAFLSTFFNWCGLHGYRERGNNPCQGVTKYKERKRQLFMGATELSILGDTISRMEQTWLERQQTKTKRTSEYADTITPQTAAAIRLLMFTGARKEEILSLKWSYIDFERGVALLPDSKTGFKALQLPAPALAVLERLPKISEWVLPAASASGHMVNIGEAWGDVRKQSGLTGWRLHDLRHAFASMMVNSGASLPIVGKILGHTQASTTQRYAHLEENPARKAAEAAAAKIADAINKPGGNVIHFSKTGEGAYRTRRTRNSPMH